MSGPDMACLVCRGSGVVRDGYAGRDERCACVEAERRDLYAPPSESWIGEALRPLLERAAREREAAEEHRRTCTARPCEPCGRFVCACGEPADGSEQCPRCAARSDLDDRLAPTVASVPTRFRWALAGDVALLSSRIQVRPQVIERGLAGPPSADLLFAGRTGAGKTSLAVAMLGAWVRLGGWSRRGALFVEAGWLSRARARHRLGEESPLVRDALAAPLLVLDDLGSEREDRDGCITDVVYGRHNAERPTWVTCGLSQSCPTVDAFGELLSRRYDGGFVRRVLETSRRVHLGEGGGS